MAEIYIKDGRIYGLVHEEFFNVALHNGDNPAVKMGCDFSGMPIKALGKIAFDTAKVKFRPHVKGMTTEGFKKAFNNKTITWREMISKEGTKSKIELADKTPAEIANEIRRLQAMLGKPELVTAEDLEDLVNEDNLDDEDKN